MITIFPNQLYFLFCVIQRDLDIGGRIAVVLFYKIIWLFLLGVQLMRGFLRDKELRIMDFPDEHNEFKSLLLGTQRGPVGEMLCTEELFDRSNLVSGDPSIEEVTLSDKQIEMVVPLPPIKRIA